MNNEHLNELGYESEEEFVAEILGIDVDELDGWFDSYDPE